MELSKSCRRLLTVAFAFCLCSGCAHTKHVQRGSLSERSTSESVIAPVAGYVRGRPTLSGSRLELRAGETATERALELMDKLAAADEGKKQLEDRVQVLEATLASKDFALQEGISEVRMTREDLARSRADLEQWKQDTQTLRAKLRDADQANLATLETTVTLLQKALEQGPKDSQKSGTPARSPSKTK